MSDTDFVNQYNFTTNVTSFCKCECPVSMESGFAALISSALLFAARVNNNTADRIIVINDADNNNNNNNNNNTTLFQTAMGP